MREERKGGFEGWLEDLGIRVFDVEFEFVVCYYVCFYNFSVVCCF